MFSKGPLLFFFGGGTLLSEIFRDISNLPLFSGAAIFGILR